MKKIKWNRVLAVLLAMVTAVSLLSACGSKSAEKEDADTITVYLWSTSLYEKYAPYIQEQLPDINVEFVVGNNDLDFYRFLNENGGLPDIINAGGKVVHAAATDILTQDGAVSAVVTTEGAIDCDAAVICTGGLSYPLTGSTGDGYRFAQRLGHTVTPTRASLVPLESEDPWCAEMQGFSLRNVTLTVYDEQNKAVYSDLGEMLFTHFGVSGPLVLSASAHMRDFSRHKYRLSIDLKPALDEKKLDARILRDFQKYANRDFKNALYDLAGHAMIPVLVRLSGIPEDTKVNVITREQRHRLVELFKHFPVSVIGTRPIDEAIITSGGVSLKEVNPRTMGSKLVHGLYFAGEVLDLDAYTGGFNLQIAWSTGYVAGNAACT